MRTTITLNDELVSEAQSYAGIREKSALIELVLKSYVQREAARRLALLGGSDPSAKAAPRRRSKQA
jgi:Arc/MetJ family transcription regulator